MKEHLIVAALSVGLTCSLLLLRKLVLERKRERRIKRLYLMKNLLTGRNFSSDDGDTSVTFMPKRNQPVLVNLSGIHLIKLGKDETAAILLRRQADLSQSVFPRTTPSESFPVKM